MFPPSTTVPFSSRHAVVWFVFPQQRSNDDNCMRELTELIYISIFPLLSTPEVLSWELFAEPATVEPTATEWRPAWGIGMLRLTLVLCIAEEQLCISNVYVLHWRGAILILKESQCIMICVPQSRGMSQNQKNRDEKCSFIHHIVPPKPSVFSRPPKRQSGPN